jgi:hypothetical protein
MKTVCFVNGSLGGAKASSLAFLKLLSAKLTPAHFRVDWVGAKPGAGGSGETLAAVGAADAVVLAFPLFSYTLPGALTALLEDFHAFAANGGQYKPDAQVFAVINCAFPEPWIMQESIRVVKNFCARLGLRYRFSIAISSGAVTAMTMKVPLLNPRLKRAFAEMARDLLREEAGPREDVYVKPIIPKPIILKIKEHYERKSLTLAPQKADR